jgi:outer membrane lipoprotein SlyB
MNKYNMNQQEVTMKVSTARKAFAIILIIAFVSALSACQYAREHEREARGAGIGAAAGAAGGLLLGGGTRGAIAGGLLGALAGGAIAHYTGERDRDAQATAQQYNYQPAQGNVVRIERQAASPQTVSPGETVNLQTTYALMTPGDEAQTVVERWEIRHNGEVVGDPQVTAERTDGTYTANLPLELPPTAAPGNYEVTSIVQVADVSETASTSFQVQ